MRSSASYNDPNGDKTHGKAARRGSGSRRRPVWRSFGMRKRKRRRRTKKRRQPVLENEVGRFNGQDPGGVPQPDLMEESLTKFNVRDGLGVG